MDELKRCSGYKGHWGCSDEYPDHMVPTSRFGPHAGQSDGFQDKCKSCLKYRDGIKNPIQNPIRAISYRLAGGFKAYYSLPKKAKSLLRNEAKQILQIKALLETGVTPKFKSKKPKFNQGLYKSSLTTPRDSTKEVEPKEGPGFVYIFEDGMKKPGFIKVGATEVVDQRLQAGNTWGAFTCLYAKKFKRRFEAEARIFELLEDYRLYRDKEWFKVNTGLAIKTIEGMYELP